MGTHRSLPGVLAFSELHLQDGQGLVGVTECPEATIGRGSRVNLGTCCCQAGGLRNASPGGTLPLGAPLEEVPLPSECLKEGWGLDPCSEGGGWGGVP